MKPCVCCDHREIERDLPNKQLSWGIEIPLASRNNFSSFCVPKASHELTQIDPLKKEEEEANSLCVCIVWCLALFGICWGPVWLAKEKWSRTKIVNWYGASHVSPSKEGEEDNDDKSPCVQLEHLQIKNWKEENVFRERGSDFPPPVSLSSTILSFFFKSTRDCDPWHPSSIASFSSPFPGGKSNSGHTSLSPPPREGRVSLFYHFLWPPPPFRGLARDDISIFASLPEKYVSF